MIGKMEKINTFQNTTFGVVMSFIIANLPVIQSFITFIFTVSYLYYKVRKTKEEYKAAKEKNDRKKSRKRK